MSLAGLVLGLQHEGGMTLAKEALPMFTGAKGDFRIPVGFILGGFVAASLGAWNTRRTNYAALCGSARAAIVRLAIAIPLPSTCHGGMPTPEHDHR